MLPYWRGNNLCDRHYKEPFKFKPERWLGDNKEVLQNNPFVFIPFSSGPRNCIGQHLALIEAKVMIAFFLRRFELVRNEKVPL